MKIFESLFGVGLGRGVHRHGDNLHELSRKVKRTTFYDQIFQVGRAEARHFLYISPIAPCGEGHKAEPTTLALARERMFIISLDVKGPNQKDLKGPTQNNKEKQR